MVEEDFRFRREQSVLSAGAAEPYDAVVFGSTGAVGREVVRALARSEQCQSVVAIVRCDVAFQLFECWRGSSSNSNLAEVVILQLRIKSGLLDVFQMENGRPDVVDIRIG